ncbi:MAG: DUF305 domain-containing protein [Anaerolineales bacterium]
MLLFLSACQSVSPDASTHEAHSATEPASVPYDALFLDSMILHHQGAVEMARQALEQAEHPELRALAEAILAAQEAEIAQMRAWREAWYPDLPATEGLHIHMGPMEVEADASRPYDLRFIEAMIPHHEGAIAMAQDALQKAEHAELRDLAQAIIVAQQEEIEQMERWRMEWYGK